MCEAIILREKGTNRVRCTLTLYCQEGRYKYVASSIVYLESLGNLYQTSFFRSHSKRQNRTPHLPSPGWPSSQAEAVLRVPATLARRQNALATAGKAPSDF